MAVLGALLCANLDYIFIRLIQLVFVRKRAFFYEHVVIYKNAVNSFRIVWTGIMPISEIICAIVSPHPITNKIPITSKFTTRET